jgi:hypothetical protein
VWSERVTAIDDPELLTHHAGWALTARYSQHVSSLLQVITVTDAHLRLRLEEYAHQVKDELMMTYRSRGFKTDDLDNTRTRLQDA